MSPYALAALSAFWMGVAATISPCPMGTNVAAVSMIAAGGGRRPESAGATAAAYCAGRMLVHAALGIALLMGFSSASGAAAMMQSVPAKLTGPLFIIAGVLLTGWIDLPMPRRFGEIKKKILKSGGVGPRHTFAVGCVFSLVPCPETAALFFGGMIPMAATHGSTVLFPLLFGLGTGLPIMVIGWALSKGASRLAEHVGGVRRYEPAFRALTSWTFIAAGLFLTLSHVYGITFI